MELQALLVLCGVGVAGVAVVLLMGLFSTSGTSYEEAIAQQRRATTELLALADNKNKSKKNNKKAIKKQAKKESKNKDNVPLASGSEIDSEAPADSGVDEAPPAKPHVEFSPPVVVDVLRDIPPNVKIRKCGKDPKVKPILINKDDPSIVTDLSTPPSPRGSTVSNHFEKIHPKDEFELWHSSIAMEKSLEKEEVAEKKEVKQLKAAKSGKTVKQPPVQEPVKEDVVKETRNNNELPKDQRNKSKKVEKRNVDGAGESVREEVVPPLNVPQPQELTTDKLLRQAPTPPAPVPPAPTVHRHKKKKHEPADVLALMAGDGGGINVNELVEVVKSATLSRTEIQILTDALLNKHHDQLPAHSEWTEGPNDPVQKLKKQLADKEKALASEVEASQALQARFKELRASLTAERTRATAAARALEAAAADAAAARGREQRLLDEHVALAQDNKMLQSKLSNEAEVQAQRVQMEMHIQRLSESEAALAAQLGALQAELQARALELGAARCEARDSALAAQHAADIAQQLQESARVCAEFEQQLQLAARNEQRLTQELRQAQERMHAMSELQNEVQRLTARAQSAESAVEKSKEDSEKQKQQITKELASVKEVLAAKEAELAEVKQMKVPAQNGLPNANDTHKMEGALSALSAQLAAAQRTSAQQQEQLTALTRELHRHQDKNNELRTKNWKVMEALQSAEKALQVKSSSMPPAQNSIRESLEKAQATLYKEIASILRSARPDLSPKGDEGRDWVQGFASNLSRDSREVTSAPAQDVVEQNRHLQGLVDKYKTVIHDTEAVLSRLQQNVSVEEQRWRQQLADKQRELDELNNKTILQMQKKIDSLQAELHQASKHSNNFTDAERLKEETLMGSLSEKYKLDVCNGPLQVGLTEK